MRSLCLCATAAVRADELGVADAATAQEDIMATTDQAEISYYRQLLAAFLKVQRERVVGVE